MWHRTGAQFLIALFETKKNRHPPRPPRPPPGKRFPLLQGSALGSARRKLLLGGPRSQSCEFSIGDERVLQVLPIHVGLLNHDPYDPSVLLAAPCSEVHPALANMTEAGEGGQTD